MFFSIYLGIFMFIFRNFIYINLYFTFILKKNIGNIIYLKF